MSDDVTHWAGLTMPHLFFAYRKAKADCFFERSICISQEFAIYEVNLVNNLSALLEILVQGDIESLLQHYLGTPRLAAKKLTVEKKSKKITDHSYFSDPSRAFQRLVNSHDLKPEFRLVGEFPVEMHILSALWINIIGHKYDAKLSNSAFGSRLRRYRSEAGSPKGAVGKYHLNAIGSFQPYFNPYKDWRGRGLKSIRNELELDHQVIAVSMDLTSYYHRLDPSFLVNSAFLKENDIFLTPWELQFTAIVTDSLNKWASLCEDKLFSFGCNASEVWTGGIPIGLSISRIISNVFLLKLDRDIKHGLSPIFYGRYVDDIFLVIRDPGNIFNSEDLLKYLGVRVDCFPQKATNSDEIRLDFGDYEGHSKIVLQKSKQKIFFLEGMAGIDLLDNIDKQIRSVSSERRLMPTPDELDSMTSAKVLTAAGHPADEADTLRRADGLAVRRLSWSVLLRAVETIARDLPQSDWKEERRKFYVFSHSHILRPDKILDHLDYLPRLLSLAVALEDWSDAWGLYDAAIAALKKLAIMPDARPKINGYEIKENKPEIWDELLSVVRNISADAVGRSLRWTAKGGMRPLSDTAKKFCGELGLGNSYEEIHFLSELLRESDWAKISYKDHLRRDATRQKPSIEGEQQLYGIYEFEEDLRVFLTDTQGIKQPTAAKRISHHCKDSNEKSLLPYLFPTRAYTPQEVTLFLPTLCVFGIQPERHWAKFVRAVRGVWVWPNLVNGEPALELSDIDMPQLGVAADFAPPYAKIGAPRKYPKVLLGITSLLTSNDTFSATAGGNSDISRVRYKRIRTVVNLAIQASPQPTHLILPELSLPERWVDTVSSFLREAGISLIAGLDYNHNLNDKSLYSEATLMLNDDRLGFPASVHIRQPKSLPAPKEDENLQHLFGRTWLSGLEQMRKPVYNHYGFCFGVLVCSELQNVTHRLKFQGHVDCLMVLSWNQDIETFSSLVEASSLDVHTNVALVNNRAFGDSRVRAPGKKAFARDLCRIKGGENEQVVIVKLEIEKLRAFQSRAKRWPTDSDPYKPVPEAFIVTDNRRTTPE